ELHRVHLGADAVLTLDLVNRVDPVRVVKDALRQRGLAAVDVSRDPDIANFGEVGQHGKTPEKPAACYLTAEPDASETPAVPRCHNESSGLECLDDNVASEFASGAMAGAALTRVESHLASCRDCRALVAALAVGNEVDSDVVTHKHDRVVVTESQAG